MSLNAWITCKECGRVSSGYPNIKCERCGVEFPLFSTQHQLGKDNLASQSQSMKAQRDARGEPTPMTGTMVLGHIRFLDPATAERYKGRHTIDVLEASQLIAAGLAVPTL